jgi:hypothetical protein
MKKRRSHKGRRRKRTGKSPKLKSMIFQCLQNLTVNTSFFTYIHTSEILAEYFTCKELQWRNFDQIMWWCSYDDIELRTSVISACGPCISVRFRYVETTRPTTSTTSYPVIILVSDAMIHVGVSWVIISVKSTASAAWTVSYHAIVCILNNVMIEQRV